jgi:hypothetical protein
MVFSCIYGMAPCVQDVHTAAASCLPIIFGERGQLINSVSPVIGGACCLADAAVAGQNQRSRQQQQPGDPLETLLYR